MDLLKFFFSILSLIFTFLLIFICFDVARFIRNFIKKGLDKLLVKKDPDVDNLKKAHAAIPVDMEEVDIYEKD